MPTGTTALGWASRIFDLGSGTMDDVARQVAGGRSVGTSMAGIRVGASIGAARTGWSSVLQSLRHGGSGADAAEGMRHVVDELESVRRLAQGRVAGHVHAASTEAAGIRDALRGAGGSTPHVDHALESRVWNFRFQLDQAWQELGLAKVMGELR